MCFRRFLRSPPMSSISAVTMAWWRNLPSLQPTACRLFCTAPCWHCDNDELVRATLFASSLTTHHFLGRQAMVALINNTAKINFTGVSLLLRLYMSQCLFTQWLVVEYHFWSATYKIEQRSDRRKETKTIAVNK